MAEIREEKLSTRKAPQVPMRDDEPEGPVPGMDAIVPVDRGPEVVATTLAPQLGSDTSHLSEGSFDMRKLSIIEEKDIPFLIYSKIRGKKALVWHMIYDEFLNLKVSVAGRGRKDIIRMEGVSKGGLPEYYPEAKKPGWVERNFTNRNWRKQAEENKF